MARDTYVPDWRNEKDYAFCDDLTDEGWAWEFLRRNPEYEEDYEQASKLEKSDRRKFGKLQLPLTTDSKHTLVYEPKKEESESYANWIERCRDNYLRPRVLTPLQAVAKRWHLEKAEPPGHHEAYFHYPFHAFATPDDIDEYMDLVDGKRVMKEGLHLAVFRMDFPLKPQTEIANHWLQAIISENDERANPKVPIPPLQPERWKTYLRIIDADDCHVTWKEVFASSIFTVNDRKKREQRGTDYARKLVFERLKAARKMSEKYIHCLNYTSPYI